MGFLIDLNQSLSKESELNIKIKTKNKKVIFKVIDVNNKGVKGVSLIVKGKKIGVTDQKGEFIVDKNKIPKKGVVNAIVGIYTSSKSFKL